MIPILRRYLRPYSMPIALVLFLLLVQAIANLYLPELNADIINNGVAKGDIDYIVQTGGYMLIVTFALMIAAFIAVYFSAKVAMGFGRDVRSAIFRKVETFSQVEINQFGAASLITRNTNDVQQVQQVVLLALTMMISAPIMAIGGVIMAYRQDGPLTAILLVILPIMVVLIAVVMRRAIPLFQVMQVRIDRINLVMRETLSGVRVIRAFVRTEHEEARFDAASRDLMDVGLRVNRLFAITMPALMLIMNLSTVAVLWLGAYRVDSGAMPIGNLTAFIQYITQILFAIMMAVIMFVMVPRAAVSGTRISEVLDTEPSIWDPPTPISPARTGRVEFRDVEFRYPGAEEPVLRGIIVRGEPGRGHGHRGLDGIRQVHAHQPPAALLRRDRRRGPRRRRERHGHGPPGPLEADRHDPAEGLPVRRHRGQQPPVRRPGRERRRHVARARDRPGSRVRDRDARAARSRRSARAAPTSRAASASAWRSPAPWPRTPTSTSSTTASAPSTSGRTRACVPRSPASWATRR